VIFLTLFPLDSIHQRGAFLFVLNLGLNGLIGYTDNILILGRMASIHLSVLFRGLYSLPVFLVGLEDLLREIHHRMPAVVVVSVHIWCLFPIKKYYY
jgi:hypothetical protein